MSKNINILNKYKDKQSFRKYANASESTSIKLQQPTTIFESKVNSSKERLYKQIISK